MGFFDALKLVGEEREGKCPIICAMPAVTRKASGMGKATSIRMFTEHWVAQQYLPTSCKEKSFTSPATLAMKSNLPVTFCDAVNCNWLLAGERGGSDTTGNPDF